MTRIRSLTSNWLDWASRMNTVSCLWSHWGTRRASWTDLLLLLVESYSVTAIGFSGATTVSFASTAHVLVQLAKSKSSRTLILPCLHFTSRSGVSPKQQSYWGICYKLLLELLCWTSLSIFYDWATGHWNKNVPLLIDACLVCVCNWIMTQ